MGIRDQVPDLRPVLGHDGRSGASLERGSLGDGTKVFVKSARIASDAAALLTGDARRELRLWKAGVLDALAPQMGTAVLAIEDHGDSIVTMSRDLGSSVLTWSRRLTRYESTAIFGAIESVHARFADCVPAGLCPTATRIGVFAPAQVDRLRRANPGLAASVERGLELFAQLVPPDVVERVHHCYQRPGKLAAALTSTGATLLHGDFCLPNVALETNGVTALDWGLATTGPAAMDLIMFCLSAMSNVDLGRQDLLDVARTTCRELVDDATFARCEFWALMELGWNKALDAVDNPDPKKRLTERADLDFWVGRARAALEAGLIPEGS